MDKETILKLNIGLFVIVAILHLWRAVAGLPLNIGTFSLPVWASYTAFVVVGLLAYGNYKVIKQ